MRFVEPLNSQIQRSGLKLSQSDQNNVQKVFTNTYLIYFNLVCFNVADSAMYPNHLLAQDATQFFAVKTATQKQRISTIQNYVYLLPSMTIQ